MRCEVVLVLAATVAALFMIAPAAANHIPGCNHITNMGEYWRINVINVTPLLSIAEATFIQRFLEII